MNISSIVVKTTQESFHSIKEAIRAIEGCEIYLADEASLQLIVVLEAPSSAEEVAINKQLELLPGVMSANMHYTYQESELNAQLRDNGEGVSEFLNDDSIKAEDIAYSGSIAHLLKQGRKRV